MYVKSKTKKWAGILDVTTLVYSRLSRVNPLAIEWVTVMDLLNLKVYVVK